MARTLGAAANSTTRSQSPVAVSAQSAPQLTDLRDEYRYVIADLKRIGAIALAMLAVLIVLAFLLT